MALLSAPSRSALSLPFFLSFATLGAYFLAADGQLCHQRE